MASEGRRKPLKHERQVVLLALFAGVPGLVLALVLLWAGDFAARTQWTLTILAAGAWLAIAATLRERVIYLIAEVVERLERYPLLTESPVLWQNLIVIRSRIGPICRNCPYLDYDVNRAAPLRRSTPPATCSGAIVPQAWRTELESR